MKTLAERISFLLEQVGHSPTRMADIAGVKPPSVSDWVNGKTKSLRAGPAIRIAKFFKVNSLWLTEGTGPMRDVSPSSNTGDDNGVPEFLLKKGEEMKTNVVDMASRRLPMPSGVVRFERLPVSMSAGPGAAEEVYGLDAVEYLDVAETWAREQVGSCDPKRIKVVTCRGDSMSPTIPNGSLLFVDVTIRRHVGDGVYALAIGDRLLVKRVNMLTKSRAFEVISDSPNGPATEVYQAHEEQQLNICGRVVAWWSLHRNV